ncbi:RecF/RecN/SMC protein [Cardiobacterium valvarum F0432]|uniref:RecF/RecN/SMC protein n=2 Tax=Cardiobacterium valvarum TaxID=194702 RepID=G9ZJC3_9GAMM|nr:RecF/RecN/SMC protein [Cardiobacterium valvarum F0432]
MPDIAAVSGSRMHIHQLTLTGFRGAKNLTLHLHPGLNVFVGRNGAGKSTLLDAGAILLSWLANRIKTAGASGRQIAESDITNGQSVAKLALELSYRGEQTGWHLVKTRRGLQAVNKAGSSSLADLSKLAAAIQEEGIEEQALVRLPLFAYYPVNRAVLDIPLRNRERHDFNPLAAYESALTGAANFRTFFEWFREREDLENEIRRDLDRDSLGFFATEQTASFPDPQLQAVREALSKLMPEFKHLTVRRSPLRMEVEKNGSTLTINQLSDGEKCLMAMVGDMARRMAVANPHSSTPLTGDGIILIDEIDLHLHPAWQKMIVPKLTAVFPNCQFLISSHSPHVITQVRPESLFLLTMQDNELNYELAAESYGKTAERVLEDLMGLTTTRPEAVAQTLTEIYQDIDHGEYARAMQNIDNLGKEIGNDPDLFKAKMLIKRKELIGR